MVKAQSGYEITTQTLKGLYSIIKREKYIAWRFNNVQYAYRYY